jgi:hypothetical protein
LKNKGFMMNYIKQNLTNTICLCFKMVFLVVFYDTK